MGNVSALLVIFASFLVPFLSSTIRANQRVMLACWLAIAAHHLAAFVNAFITPLSSAWGDLYRFHDIGAGILEEDQPYGLLLRLIYRTLGTSFWLGESVSVFVFAISLLVFVNLQVRLKLSGALVGSVLLYGLLPGPLAHCSVTMREVYQELGLMGGIWGLVAIYQDGPKASLFLAVLMSLSLMVFMHQSLSAFALLFLCVGLPWALRGRGKIGGIMALFFILTLPMLLPKMGKLLESDSPTMRAFNEGRILEYAANYRTYVNESRSDYGVTLETDSLPSFVATGSVVLLMYFFAPLPWQASSGIDYYAFFEVVLRLALFYGAYRAYLQAEPREREAIGIAFWLAFLLEILWAVGTSNWGTALRHHVPSSGIFLALGAPFLCQFTLDPELTRLHRRRQAQPAENSSAAAITVGVAISSALRLLRSYARLILVVTFVVALLIGWRTWPDNPFGREESGGVFVASGSVLLQDQSALTVLTGGSGGSDVAMWMSTPNLFYQFLSRNKITDKILLRVANNAELKNYVSSVQIQPQFNKLRENEAYALRERDYATLGGPGFEKGDVRTGQTNRIVFTAYGPNPQDAQRLCRASISVFQDVLEAVAVRRIQSQKANMQRYYATSRKRLARAEALVDRLQAGHGKQGLPTDSVIKALEGRCRELELEVANFSRQLDVLGRDAAYTVPNTGLEQSLEIKQNDLLLMRNIYMPDSAVVQRAQRRLTVQQQLMEKLQAESAQRFAADLETELQVRQSLLQQYRAELLAERRLQPSAKVRLNYQSALKELTMWDAEAGEWEAKILGIRLQEQVARASGSSVLLQDPLPGHRQWLPVAAFYERFSRTLKLLPVAPVAGLLMAMLVHIWRETNRLYSRVGYYCAAPVLASLPRISGAQASQWKRMKGRVLSKEGRTSG